MAEGGWALVLKVRVGVGSRAHAVVNVEVVALAGDCVASVAANVWQEPALAEARDFVVGTRGRGAGAVAPSRGAVAAITVVVVVLFAEGGSLFG